MKIGKQFSTTMLALDRGNLVQLEDLVRGSIVALDGTLPGQWVTQQIGKCITKRDEIITPRKFIAKMSIKGAITSSSSETQFARLERNMLPCSLVQPVELGTAKVN